MVCVKGSNVHLDRHVYIHERHLHIYKRDLHIYKRDIYTNETKKQSNHMICVKGNIMHSKRNVHIYEIIHTIEYTQRSQRSAYVKERPTKDS